MSKNSSRTGPAGNTRKASKSTGETSAIEPVDPIVPKGTSTPKSLTENKQQRQRKHNKTPVGTPTKGFKSRSKLFSPKKTPNKLTCDISSYLSEPNLNHDNSTTQPKNNSWSPTKLSCSASDINKTSFFSATSASSPRSPSDCVIEIDDQTNLESLKSNLNSQSPPVSCNVNESVTASANNTVEFESTLNWHPSVSDSQIKEQESPYRAPDAKGTNTSTKKKTAGEEMASADQSNYREEERNHTTGESNPAVQTHENGYIKQNSQQDEPDITKLNEGTEGNGKMESISTTKVMEMFNQLMNNMNSMKADLSADIKEIKTQGSGNAIKIKEVEQKQTTQDQELVLLKKENVFCKQKLLQLAGAYSHQKQVMNELHSRLDMIEKDRYKPKMVIQGIPEREGISTGDALKEFFKTELKLAQEVKVKFSTRMGNRKNRPILLHLVNAFDKGLIYTNAKNLQGKKGANDKSYKIEDYLPAKDREIKKRNRDFMWRNKRSVAEKLTMSVVKGKLMVDRAAYQQRIKVPDTSKLLQLKPDEIDELEKIQIRSGTPHQIDTSTFMGYVCSVSNFNDVNHAYEWVRYHNMDARHIIAACKIPGDSVINSVDYNDNEEHSAGQKLFDFMESANLENRAIFVTRHYDGRHVGPQRFDYIINAAKSAVNQNPFNDIAGKFQFSWPSNTYDNTSMRIQVDDEIQLRHQSTAQIDTELHTEPSAKDWASSIKTPPAANTADDATSTETSALRV